MVDEAHKLLAQAERKIVTLTLALQAITHKAKPIATDDDGFVAMGYTLPIGPVHRAIALVGAPRLDGSTAVLPAGYRIIGPEDEERIRTLAHTDHSWHGLNDESDPGAGYWVSPGKFLALLQGDET